jgi:hypothetical protein
MAAGKGYKWRFKARFRRGAFGWKSQPAIKRVHEAVAEIRSVARKDPLLAAEGAIIFLEKVSPALENVDSSSGAIGTAVNHAIEAIVPVIADAPADPQMRDGWLERLYDAYQSDEIPYIETLGDHWGTLCASKAMASLWADRLIGMCKMAWSRDPNLRGYFAGSTTCLSALLAAERYEEILGLLEGAPWKMWHYRQYGVKALAAMGKTAEAIRYAEEGRGLNDSPTAIARVCEAVLLSSGLADEAYRRYGLEANRAGTYVAWFRAVLRKYPHKNAEEILADLVGHTPGDEGKWFAAAKDAKLFDQAIALANRAPCSPQTLSRAARDFTEKNPAFAVEAGLAALRWLAAGYGYEVTGLDVMSAYDNTIRAADNLGCRNQVIGWVRELLKRDDSPGRFVAGILRQRLERSQ